MKRFAPLIAMFATAATTAAVWAEERSDVRLLGSLTIGGAADSGRSGVGLFREGEIELNATVVLSEDVKITTRFELEAHTSRRDQIDETYVSIHTKLGRLKIGGDDTAKATYTNGILYSPGSRIGYYDTFPLALNSAMAFVDGGGDPIGIYYDSPSINGFRFGFSYHPDADRDGSGFVLPDGTFVAGDGNEVVYAADGRIDPATGDVLLLGEQYSVGASYQRDIGENGFGVSAGWVRTEGLVDAWHVGGYVYFSRFALAGHYEDDSSEEIALGAIYGFDSWTVGGGFAEDWVGGDDNQVISGWVSYELTPGLDATVGFEHHDDSTNTRSIAGAAVLRALF